MEDDPNLDGTDAAHPAWWRGQERGVDGTLKILAEALGLDEEAAFHEVVNRAKALRNAFLKNNLNR